MFTDFTVLCIKRCPGLEYAATSSLCAYACWKGVSFAVLPKKHGVEQLINHLLASNLRVLHVANLERFSNILRWGLPLNKESNPYFLPLISNPLTPVYEHRVLQIDPCSHMHRISLQKFSRISSSALSKNNAPPDL